MFGGMGDIQADREKERTDSFFHPSSFPNDDEMQQRVRFCVHENGTWKNSTKYLLPVPPRTNLLSPPSSLAALFVAVDCLTLLAAFLSPYCTLWYPTVDDSFIIHVIRISGDVIRVQVVAVVLSASCLVGNLHILIMLGPFYPYKKLRKGLGC